MYVPEVNKLLVADFMHKKEKVFNPLTMLILDPVFQRDLEYFIKTYYQDFSQMQTREAAETFCEKYRGYKQTYGIPFTENALIQIFF